MGDMPSKYATTLNVRYDETCVMTSHVHHSEQVSVIYDCTVFILE